MSNIGIMIPGIILFFIFFVPFCLLLDFVRSQLRRSDPEPSCDNCKNYAECVKIAGALQDYNLPENGCAYWKKKKP